MNSQAHTRSSQQADGLPMSCRSLLKAPPSLPWLVTVYKFSMDCRRQQMSRLPGSHFFYFFNCGRGTLKGWGAHPTLLGGQQREQRAAVQLSHQQLRHAGGQREETHSGVHDGLLLRFPFQCVVVRGGWGGKRGSSARSQLSPQSDFLLRLEEACERPQTNVTH